MGKGQKSQEPITCYSGGILCSDGERREGDLWVSGGRFLPPQPRYDARVDLDGALVTPGFIDLQVNGGFGMDCYPLQQELFPLSEGLWSQGVTRFLPTLVSAPLPHYAQRLQEELPPGGLGYHLEGPFLSPDCVGAHSPEHLARPHEGGYPTLRNVRLVTLAPELPGCLDLIGELAAQKIAVAGGHTGASGELWQEAIARGLRCATHLCNAMPPFHHRRPGPVAAILTQKLSYSLICDGEHLAPEAVALLHAAHPEGLFLISDLVGPTLAGQGIRPDLPLAGSCRGLSEGLCNLIRWTGLSFVEALAAVTTRPAQLVGVAHRFGTLRAGAYADFLLWEGEETLSATYVEGERRWER